MTRIFLAIVVLFVASLALAQQSGVPGTPEVVVTASTSVTVQSGVVSYGSVRLPVQKVLHRRPLTCDEDEAVRKYMANPARACALRKAGNYEATEASIRLLIGIEQAHLPLAWRPKDYMSSAQIVWQMLAYLETYVDVPVQSQRPALILPPLIEIESLPPVQDIKVRATVPTAMNVTRKETVTVCQGHVSCGRADAGCAGALRFGKSGSRDEHLLGAIGFEWCDKCQKEHAPGTCDPDGDGPPLPNGGEVGGTRPPCDASTPGGRPGAMTGVPNGSSGIGGTAPGIPSGPNGTTYNPATPETTGASG